MYVYIAIIDSLRQQFYPRKRQAGRDRKISDNQRKGFSFPMCEKNLYLPVLIKNPCFQGNRDNIADLLSFHSLIGTL